MDSSDPLPSRMTFKGEPEAESTPAIPWLRAVAAMSRNTTRADPPTV